MTRHASLNVGVAIAVLLSLLAVAGAPASAASTTLQTDGLVVGSQHSTDSDFNDATLTNMTIDGSGESAVVTIQGGSSIEYSNFEDRGDGTSETVGSLIGDDGSDNPIKTEYEIVPTESGELSEITFVIESTFNSDYGPQADIYFIQEDADQTYGEGTQVASDVSFDWSTGPQTVSIDPQSVTNGTTYTIEVVTQSSDNDGTSDQLQVGLDDSANEIRATATTFGTYQGWGSINATSSGTPSAASYVSPLHNVSNPQEAAINISAYSNVSVEATVRTDGGTVLNQSTLSGTGNHTLQLANTSSSQLETVLDINVTGDNPQFELADESILFTNHQPQASNISPANGTELQASSVTFSVDVNDTEFPTAQGDSVTAELYIDGSSLGSDTVTSNSTVEITETLSTGGSHDYYWELTDSYGATTTTSTKTVKSPSELKIRSETNPEALVSDAQVNITYYYGDDILRANSSDGTVNLTGLPVDEPIIALAEADGYHTRTAVITDIYQQDSLYLLNSSLDSYELIFDISDPTGAYPRSDTILEVQRDIELNNSTEWRTVAGDVFGAQGVTTDLQAGERYRLVLRNLETNEVASLGSFTPTASQTVTLEPESATVDVSADSDSTVGYAASRSSDGSSIVVEYSDPNQTTDTFTYRIVERNNESNVLVSNQSYSDLGNLSVSEPLNATAQNTSWTVEMWWEKSDGTQGHAFVNIGQGTRDVVPGILSNVWRASAGVAALLITALLFSQLNVGVGAITTALAGGLLWYIGLLSTITTGPAVVLSIAVGGLIHYNRGGGAAT